MFNLLMILMTLIAAGFVAAWFLRPDFRRWIEQPKYRQLEQIKKFEQAAQAVAADDERRTN